MKTEITIPAHFPELKEDELKAAIERRENYSIARDILAREFNEAIANRLRKEQEQEKEGDK